MQIFIRESTENKEWYILDLQGHLEYTGDLKNETLGTLTKKPNSKDDFTFQIGNSVLNGKEVPLKKPLLVIRKKKIDENIDNEDVTMIDTNEIKDKNNETDESEIEYIIEGMAQSKITFTTRPTTIIPQSSVVYGSPTHKSPTNSPTNTPNNKSNSSTPSNNSPIKQPQFN